ncbi:MAG: glycosyltransferase family 4 protein [Chloroflexi bacterium]|nr:glycosyltransferase family 4 protein [Chloroflexota bacterium]
MFTPAIGGAEQYLRDLLWSLDRSRYEITLFYEPWPAFEQFLGLDHCPQLCRCPIPVYEDSQFLHNSVQLPRNLKRLRYFFNHYVWRYIQARSNYSRLGSALAAMPIDILHINNGGYPGATTAQLASLAAKTVGIPICIMTIANTPAGIRFPKLVERWLDQRVGSAVDKFVVVSNDTGRVLQQKRALPVEKIQTIYYGIPPVQRDLTDKAIERQTLGLSPTSVVIGMAARMTREKGHTILLQALAQLYERIEGRVEVLLLGEGALLTELKTHSLQLGLGQMVKFTGRLPNEEALRTMSVCNIITLPSEIEGLPYAITEAMSLGKPVVTTTVGGIPEQVVHGETGLLVPPRDSTALAEALWHMIANPELRQQMGRKAYQRYQTLFTFERMLHEHEALYQALLR